ncbi:MAG: penicillin-binding transpeptidase domain-containing protein [Bdellovibrionota bacterium]
MKKLIIVYLTLLCAGCVTVPKDAPVNPKEGSDFFPNMRGCFLLYNLKTGIYDKAIGDTNCLERTSASSTFKIPLSVMAFDNGTLAVEDQVIKWDGKKDSRPEANKDQTPRTWMQNSIVWVSQKLTPKIGKDRIQKYLQDFKYGNAELTPNITNAWLASPSNQKVGLKISSYEQAEFMKRLWKSELPVNERAMQLTRDITYLETSPKNFRLNGKTGSNYYDKERKIRLGWFVGHIDNGEQEYVVVTSFSDSGPTSEKLQGGAKAKEITKKILAANNLW